MSKSTDVELMSPRLLQLIEERGMILTTDEYGNLKLGFAMEEQTRILAEFLGFTREEADAIPSGLRLRDNTWELIMIKILMGG